VTVDGEHGPDGEHELPPGRYLQVEVTDNGTGMTEEVRRRIFEPFFTTKPVGKGTGMGLASVFGTVKMHRGRIRVESEPGRGTRFQILLPLAAENVDSGVPPEKRVRTERSLRVLAVDDDPGVRDLVLDLLRAAGHQAVGASDGRQALALYRERWKELDLVLLDMVMPEMDGQDTFHALRRVNPAARVIILSGYSLEGKVQGLLSDGAAGFLRKPISMADLDQMLAQVASPEALARR
jgi:CheY-like chemotaxis protein